MNKFAAQVLAGIAQGMGFIFGAVIVIAALGALGLLPRV